MMPDRNKVAFLLVEDNAIDVEAFERAIRRHEIQRTVHVRENAADALALLRAHSQDEMSKRFIVFLDLNMPAVSGHDLLTEIRNDPQLCNSIVFVLTTSDLESDVRKAYEKNVAGYFTKDRIDDLMRAIKPFSESVLPPPHRG
jgi:CheY-like chemotaxis protein